MNIEFGEISTQIRRLHISNISDLFVQHKKSFINFLAQNCTTVKELHFFECYFKFKSLNAILENLPQVNEIRFFRSMYEVDVQRSQNQRVNCPKLSFLEIDASDEYLLYVFENSFVNIRTLKYYPQTSMLKVLKKFPNLTELTAYIHGNYCAYDSNSKCLEVPQLKTLKIGILTSKIEIQYEILNFLEIQNNLKELNVKKFGWSFGFLKQKIPQILIQMRSLHTLKISGHLIGINKKIQEFNTSLVKLQWYENGEMLRLPKFIFKWFFGLKIIEINIAITKSIHNDFWSTLNKSELQSIKMQYFPIEFLQCISKIKLKTLKNFAILFSGDDNKNKFNFLLLEGFFKNNPNILDFSIDIRRFKTSPITDLLKMIINHLECIENLSIQFSQSQIRSNSIEKLLAPLKTLKTWQISNFKSKSFYKQLKSSRCKLFLF